MGMVRTFQLTKVMGKLTVMENMRLGATEPVRRERLSKALFKGIWGGQEKKITEQADVLLEKFKLDAKKDDYAASLSGGQRKLLEMARSLMVRPKLVMLDEPMAGVNPALTQSLLDHVKNLKAEGMTVLFVEHDMHMVRHIADWVVVMAEGKIVAEGPPGDVMKNPAVIDAYLGAHHDVDLGDAEGIEALAEELAPDAESIVGTDDEGVISPTATSASTIPAGTSRREADAETRTAQEGPGMNAHRAAPADQPAGGGSLGRQSRTWWPAICPASISSTAAASRPARVN